METCPKCSRWCAERNHYTKLLKCYNKSCDYEEKETEVMEIKDLKCCANCIHFNDGCSSLFGFKICDCWEWDEITEFERRHYEN